MIIEQRHINLSAFGLLVKEQVNPIRFKLSLHFATCAGNKTWQIVCGYVHCPFQIAHFKVIFTQVWSITQMFVRSVGVQKLLHRLLTTKTVTFFQRWNVWRSQWPTSKPEFLSRVYHTSVDKLWIFLKKNPIGLWVFLLPITCTCVHPSPTACWLASMNRKKGFASFGCTKTGAFSIIVLNVWKDSSLSLSQSVPKRTFWSLIFLMILNKDSTRVE